MLIDACNPTLCPIHGPIQVIVMNGDPAEVGVLYTRMTDLRAAAKVLEADSARDCCEHVARASMFSQFV